MELKIFRYGTLDLDQATIFHNIALNIGSYMDHLMYSPEERTEFNNSVTDIVNKMKEGTLRSDEIGNLTTTGTWENNDMSRLAVDYVKKVMTAVAKKFPKKEEVVEEPVKEKFDYNKHGLLSYITNQYSPFGNDINDDITLRKNELGLENFQNEFLNHINTHSQTLDNYDWSESNITKDLYLTMLDNLKNNLSGSSYWGTLRFSNNFGNLFKEDTPKDTKLTIEEFKNKLPEGWSYNNSIITSPTGETDYDINTLYDIINKGYSLNDGYWVDPKGNLTSIALHLNPLTPENYQIEENEYENNLDNHVIDLDYDLTSIAGPLLLDAYSIISPEPISATVAGLGSDFWNFIEDEDRYNNIWSHIGNIGATVLGAVPYVGDVGNISKFASKLKKAKGALVNITKIVGGPAAIVGTMTLSDDAANLLSQSWDKFINDSENLDVQDWINLSHFVIGLLRAYKNHKTVNKEIQTGNQYKKVLERYGFNRSKVSNSSLKPTADDKMVSINFNTNKLLQYFKNKKIKKSVQQEITDIIGKIPQKSKFTFYKSHSKEYNEAINKLTETLKITAKEAENILKELGKFLQGGILKMDNGGWFEKVLKKLGQQTSLNGWTPELNNSNRGSLNKNLNASNVSTLYELNDAYTKDLTAVNKDLNAYFTTPGSEVMSPEQLINLYNLDIELIDSYHNDPYTYGDTKEGLADAHKRVYASMNLTGDKAYNIGFNEDIKNEMGSGNFHRRAVKYEKDFDTLSDLEKQNRIYQIGGGDKSFWVKTLADGKIGLLDNAEAARILAVKPAESTETKLEGGGEGGIKIPEKEAKLVKPKDKDLNNQDYTLFGNVFKYLDTLRHNKKQMDLANLMTPLLYDPVEHNRYVVGNLDAVTQGQLNYAKLRLMASRPMTSDASLQLASQLEAESKGLEYLTQGKILDNQAIRESLEQAWEQEKANKENRYNIAMKNRENIWQVDREKLQARMVKERSDWQSKQHLMDSAITSLIGYQQRYNAEVEKDNAEQEAAFGKMLVSHIEKTPNSYIEGWDKNFQAAYDKYQRGETLNERETQMINQIHQAMEDAYLENMHPNYKWNSARVYLNRIHKGDFNFDILLPRKLTAEGKKGMKITNDMAKTIIAYLKESNNMYNKSVDRSVRGLYNHIKEQKRNKRK